eukprot:g20434.t1
MRTLIMSNCSTRDCRDVLLQISPLVYLTCRQLRRLLNVFQGSQTILLDVITTFVNRTVDWYLNEKIVRAAVWSSVWKSELQSRLGSFALFPWVQPENWVFELDFRYHEDRLCLQGILQFEGAEEGENILDVNWDKDHDGTPDLLVAGIPRAWELEQPKAGLLKVTYACAPEYAQVKFRLKLAAINGFWNVDPDLEKETKRIDWWMSIEETPEYMLDMGILMMHKFPNLRAAFKYLDRYKRRQVNLQDVRAQFTRMRASKRALSKLQECFRFLDRGNEGTVSWDEFSVFQRLWNEMFMGLEEFIYHLRFKMAVERRARERNYLDPRRRKKEDVLAMKGVKMVAAAPKDLKTDEVDDEEEKERKKTKAEKKTKMKKKSAKAETAEDLKRKALEERKRLMERTQPEPVVGFLDDSFEPLSLEEAWEIMDADGGGSLSMTEFVQIIGKYQYRRQNVGIIYNFLDADGDEIEKEEWMTGLEAMMKKMRSGETPEGVLRTHQDTHDLLPLLDDEPDFDPLLDGAENGSDEEEDEDEVALGASGGGVELEGFQADIGQAIDYGDREDELGATMGEDFLLEEEEEGEAEGGALGTRTSLTTLLTGIAT